MTEITNDNISDAIGDTLDTGKADAKSFLARAQEVIEDAVETTIDAVKENPVTAAVIAGGVAVAAAGAVYGVSRLLEPEATPAKPEPKAK